MLIAVDASAIVKLMVAETESQPLASYVEMAAAASHQFAASQLAAIETARALRRAAPTLTVAEHQAKLDQAFTHIQRVSISDEIVRRAQTVGSVHLRSLDAIHLATALELQADLMVAYDTRLLTACAAAGLPTISPGRANSEEQAEAFDSEGDATQFATLLAHKLRNAQG